MKIAAILTVAIFLISSAYAATLCSYKGPDTSEHDLQLSDFLISGDSPVKVGDKVSVSFTLTYVGKYSVTFDDNYGVFVAAKDPDGKSKMFGNTYQGKTLKAGSSAPFETDITVDKEGEWTLWASYCIKSATGGTKCGPEEWHSCKIKVEAKPTCPEGCECLTPAQAKELGYEYCEGEKVVCDYDQYQNPMYCYEKPAVTPTPSPAPKHSPTPEVTPTPSVCPSDCDCLTPAQAKELGYEYCQGRETICGYGQYQNPMYCFEKTPETPTPETCPEECECIFMKPPPEAIGYEPCREDGERIRCGRGGYYCYRIPKELSPYPCPPFMDNCGYGSHSQFAAEFTHWDAFAIGDVLGDGMDEIIIAMDDHGGKLFIYDGWGNKLVDTGVRYTPYDRLAVGDLVDDEKKEIIIAVDEDASGDDGEISIYQVKGTPGSYYLDKVSCFTARFTHYDALLAGNIITDDEKDELAIAIDEDDKLYIFDGFEGSMNLYEVDFPVNINEFRYTAKKDAHDEIVFADVIGASGDEVIYAQNKNDLKGNSKLYIYRVVSDGAGGYELKLLRSFSIAFTKYDGLTVGDVLGDQKEEILIGIDELGGLFIYDATGWIKVHNLRWTKYDGLATGRLQRVEKEQVAIAIDEDNKIYLAYEEDLLEELR